MSTDERFDRVIDIYDKLGGDARRAQVEQALLQPQTAEDLQRARAFVNDAIERGVVTAGELARRTNVKPTAISTFRNDKWNGSSGTELTTAGILVRGIEQVLQLKAAADTDIGGYVTTRFAEAVYSLTRYAMKRRLLGVFVAPAGAGKSTVLRAIHNETPGSMLITVKQRRSAPKSFMQIWARELCLRESGRAEDIQDRIVRALHGTDRLMLIDEAHKLTTGTLDVIREVWDEVKCPIVLAGTPSFYQTLTTRRVGEAATELMDQLFSRIGVFRDLVSLANPQTGEPEPLFTVDDIVKVFRRSCVRLAKDGADFLCKLANHPGIGGLRICADLVQMVVDLYPEQEVNAQRLCAAMAMRAGTAEAGFTLSKAGIADPAAAQVRAVG